MKYVHERQRKQKETPRMKRDGSKWIVCDEHDDPVSGRLSIWDAKRFVREQK